MFRRPRRMLPPRLLIANNAINDVARANQLMASGQPMQAAVLFMQLAGQMEVAGRLRQAANLHAQAAHALINVRNEQRAMNQAGQAMQLFARLGMVERAQEFKANFSRHLQEAGYESSADSIGRAYNTVVAVVDPQPEQKKRGSLPPACPHCGAPVRSDVVEWIDEQSAECGFCSGVVNTNSE
jgi:hypothetical protein